MSSNLPPGVSESDLPGCSPMDEMFDRFLDSKDCPNTDDMDVIEEAFKSWYAQRTEPMEDDVI